MAITYTHRRELARTANDISGLVKAQTSNVRRRNKALKSLEYFARAYFPEVYYLPFSDIHKQVIQRLEETITKGKCFALALPRGSGKTSLCETAILWAVLGGHCRCAVLLGCNASRASGLLKDLFSYLCYNDLLLQDFPELIAPFRKCDGNSRLLCSYNMDGAQLGCFTNASTIAFPSSNATGGEARITATGLTGGNLRGSAYVTKSGEKVRPDLVLIDDPQSREVASSPDQIADRLKTINADVLGMAGAGKKISCLVTCTVIEPNDLAERLLDKKQSPEFNAYRFSLISDIPKNITLWDEWNALRLQDDTLKTANIFYAEHKDEMNEGVICNWKERKNEEDVDALTHAMKLYYRDKDAFMTEYQNLPARMNQIVSARGIDTSHLLAGLSKIPMNTVVPGDDMLTAFIDVHQRLLYYSVYAWNKTNETGRLVDFGTYPPQEGIDFNMDNAKTTLTSIAPWNTFEENLTEGLTYLLNDIINRRYETEEDTVVPLARIMVDCNWAETTDLCYRIIKSMKNPIITPSHGQYQSARNKNKFAPKDGDRFGQGWIMPKKVKDSLRYVRYDTNQFKTAWQRRSSAPPNARGSIVLTGDDRILTNYLRHLQAEECDTIYVNGKEVQEWVQKPKRPDNHWLDTAVGCLVGAYIEGLTGMNNPKQGRISNVYAKLRQKGTVITRR